MKRNPNGFGSVIKLKGNRRKPYMAYKTSLRSKGNILPKDVKNRSMALKTALKTMSEQELINEVIDIIKEVKPGIDIKAEAYRLLADFISENDFKGYYHKDIIGYYATSKEANIALAEANKNNIDLTNNPTLEEVYNIACDDKGIIKQSKSTQKTYKGGFKTLSALHDKPIRDVTLADMQHVIDEKRGLSLSVQTNIIKVCHLIFRYAIAHNLCTADYSSYLHTVDVKETQKKNAFTEKEIKLIKDSGYTDIYFLIYTGLRISEYLGLTKDDFHGDYIYVAGTKNETSKRYVPLIPELQDLELHWSELSYATFRLRFREVMSELGMKHTIHETRHTFATITKKFKLDNTLRAYMLGHIVGSITDDLYTHKEELIPELIEEIKKVTAI